MTSRAYQERVARADDLPPRLAPLLDASAPLVLVAVQEPRDERLCALVHVTRNGPLQVVTVITAPPALARDERMNARAAAWLGDADPIAVRGLVRFRSRAWPIRFGVRRLGWWTV